MTPGKSGGLSHFEYQAGLDVVVLIPQTDIDVRHIKAYGTLIYEGARGSSIFVKAKFVRLRNVLLRAFKTVTQHSCSGRVELIGVGYRELRGRDADMSV